MSPMDYLKAIRRRWVDVVLAVVVASGIGFGLSAVAPAGPVTQTYEATSVLLASGDFYTPGYGNLEVLAELTTVGEVPRRAAEELDYDGEPLDLAAQIEATADKEAGILRIKSTSTDAGEAARLANTFSDELVAFMQELRVRSQSTQVQASQDELERLQQAIDDARAAMQAAPPREVAERRSEYEAALSQYSVTYAAYLETVSPSTESGTALDVVQEGVAIPVDTGGIQPPQSRLSRVLLAAFLGLISGIVIVLLVDRFDTRIRNKKAAEKYFRLPVLAEIPFVSRLKRKRRGLALEAEPRSPAADAFRMLATMLSMPPAQIDPRFAAPTGGNGNGTDDGTAAPKGAADVALPRANGYAPEPGAPPERAPADDTALDRPKTILVTSPGPSDGKTTVAANLAVAFGQLGKRVIVLSCDLRRPSIHRLFDLPNDQGLADKLDAGNGKSVLNGEVRETKFPNVWVVPSGPPPNSPGRLLASPQMRRALAEARRAADVTIVDTAPILTTSDAANLIPHVDAVVLIGRAGRTTSDVAQQTTQLIARLGGRVRGVVLNAAVESTLPRRYYYYRYYRQQRPKTTRRSKAGKGSPYLARHSGGS